MHAQLEELLGGGIAEQRVALSALQKEMQRAGTTPSAHVIGYMRTLLPSIACLLHRSTPPSRADKPAALRLLLLACALSPAEALAPLLSLALPLIIGCLSISADGAVSAEQRELSALAHTSLTALAKRSPHEFRTVAAAFSSTVRTRMETALKEAAAHVAAPVASGGAVGAVGGGAAPKIALKMDFSAFGKKA